MEKNGESPGRKERGVEVSDLTRIQIAELEKTIRRLKEVCMPKVSLLALILLTPPTAKPQASKRDS